VFAALLPLPAAPTPQDAATEGDSATNAAVNSSNLIRYQNALVLFAGVATPRRCASSSG
jgi:hypothetical protein